MTSSPGVPTRVSRPWVPMMVQVPGRGVTGVSGRASRGPPTTSVGEAACAPGAVTTGTPIRAPASIVAHTADRAERIFDD